MKRMKRVLLSILSSVILIAPVVGSAAWAQPIPANLFPILEGIELTQSQEAQLAQVRQNTRAQLELILTPTQRNQFKTALEQGGGLRQAIAAMNLSSDQQSQLRQVFRSARTQLSEVLTPTQKQKLMENVRSQLMPIGQ